MDENAGESYINKLKANKVTPKEEIEVKFPVTENE